MIFIVALVDFLTFSVPFVLSQKAFLSDLFGCVDWQQGRGQYGYQDCVYYGGIRVFSNSDNDQSVCVSMSGSGCRTFETLKGSGFDWASFLQGLSVGRFFR